MPSPASVPVHATGMLVVPENVQTGSPPFLKCGEAARAGDDVKTIAANSVARMTMIRRMIPSKQIDAKKQV